MAGNRDDQLMEVEALKSIYFEEFEELSEDPIAFNLKLAAEDSSDIDARFVTKCACVLAVEFTPEYPAEEPKVELEDIEGLSDESVVVLRELVSEQIKMNMHTSMIFTIATFVKEWLTQEYATNIQNYTNECARKADEEEEAERRKFVGNLVNPVSFAEWRRKFDAEMAAAKAATAGPEDKRKRLTGRQMFESDAALSKSDQVADGEEVIEVDEALFAELGDLGSEEEDEDEVRISIDV